MKRFHVNLSVNESHGDADQAFLESADREH
jgi:hypothetical protein